MYTEEQRRLAEAVQRSARADAEANPHNKITKELLLKLGQVIWPYSYKLDDSDQGAAFQLLTHANRAVARRHPYWTLLAAELLLPQNQLAYSGAALWCHQGFPQIVMGHKYAAALLATKITRDTAAQVKPPWRAFFIEIPRGLLFLDDARGGLSTLTGVLVASIFHAPSGQPRWSYFALSEGQTTLWQHGAAVDNMLDCIEVGEWAGTVFTEEIVSVDKRCSNLLGRLIFNVCLAMSDPSNVKAPKDPKPKKKGKHNARESSEPRVRTYQLGTTPAIDCREAVANYARTGKTGGGPLTVQFMVAGHWRNVVHGPERALRRTQWIEPYWKGNEEAPILVAPKVLREP